MQGGKKLHLGRKVYRRVGADKAGDHISDVDYGLKQDGKPQELETEGFSFQMAED